MSTHVGRWCLSIGASISEAAYLSFLARHDELFTRLRFGKPKIEKAG